MRRLALLALALVPCLLGCASHVEWRADSRSFLYSVEGGEIRSFDLESKAAETFVNAGTIDGFTAFSTSPDGKLIAFARSRAVGNGTQLVETELRLVDGEGKDHGRANLSWHAAKDPNNDRKTIPTYVEWSPTGEHVLLATDSSVALWERKAATFVTHEELQPILPLFFGASPWRPDGNGFLALADDDGEEGIVYVEIDGTRHDIELADGFRDGDDAKSDRPRGEWRGNVLTIETGDARRTIDTKSLRGERETIEPSDPRSIPIGVARLTLGPKSDGEGDADENRVVWTRGDDMVVITESLPPTFSLRSPIVVSPDGKWAVVVTGPELVLVGENGLVARVPVTAGVKTDPNR